MSKTFCRIVAVFLVMCFFLTGQIGEVKTVVAEQTADKITYEFDETTGTLTLTGEGEVSEMENYRESAMELIIGKGITTINERAFNGYKYLKKLSLPEGLERIGEAAFGGCSKLEEIEIPSTVKYIDDYAFSGCGKAVKLSLPEGLEKVGVGAFCVCSKLEKVEIPSTVKEIENRAFEDCYELKKVKLSEGVEKIGVNAFGKCANIDEIEIPSTVKYIESLAFPECSVKKLTLPEGLISIGEHAFINCSTLDKVVLPSTLTDMGESVFNSNSLLLCKNNYQVLYCQKSDYSFVDSSNGLDFSKANVSIPEFVNGKDYMLQYTGDEICPELQITYEFTSGLTATLEKDVDYTVSYANNIDCGMATITITGAGVFEGEKSLNFEIYKSVDNWDVELEYEAILYDGGEKLPVITIREGETTLIENKDYKLKYANNIEEGRAVVTVTGMGCYKGTVEKKFSIYKKDICNCKITQEYTEVLYDGMEKKPVVMLQDADGKILKESVDYQLTYENTFSPGTASIKIQGLGAYKGQKTLIYNIQKMPIDNAEVTLDATIFTYDGSAKQPQVVVKLGERVLTQDVDYSLSYLNNITVGTAQAVIQGIGNYTGEVQMSFTILPYGGSSESVYEKESTFISNHLVYTITDDNNFEVEVAGVSTKDMDSLVIPGTVTVEGKVYKVTSIGQRAFYKNTKITSIVIGNNVTSVEDYAFYGCKNVKKIIMGNLVEMIGASSFRKCTKLTGIVLPKSMNELGKNAFYGCKKLKSITINAGSVVDISDSAIKGISKKAIIKVPKKLVKKYKKELKGKTGFKKTMKIKKK